MTDDISGYEINQKGKVYILLIDLQENDLMIKCVNKTSGDFFFSKKYNISDLHSINKHYHIYETIKEIQQLLNVAVEKAKIGLLEDFNQITIFFYLIFDLEETTMAFPLIKDNTQNKNSNIKELNNLNDNDDYIKNLKDTINKLEEDNNNMNQKNITLIEQMKKLNIELTQLKNELTILKENNDILKTENEKLIEYKNKYEEIIKESDKNSSGFKDELKISSVINEIFCGKNQVKDIINENIKGKEKLNLYEHKNEGENDLNIIDNDNFENENEPSIENNIVDRDIIKSNININNKLDNADEIKAEKEVEQNTLLNKINNEEEKINVQENIIQDDETHNINKNNSNNKVKEIDNNEENINKSKNENKLSNEKNIEEDSEQEIEFIRNNEIVNTTNKKFDEIEEDIEKNFNNDNEDLANKNRITTGDDNVQQDKIEDFNEKENININQEDIENIKKEIRDSINKVVINNKEIIKQENKNNDDINELHNLIIDIKENKNIDDNENINKQIYKIVNVDEIKIIEADEKPKEQIKKEIEKNNDDMKLISKEKELINKIEKNSEEKINEIVINIKENNEIKKEELKEKNIEDIKNEKETIINKEKHSDKKTSPNVENKEINTNISFESLKTNNINYEQELNNSFITKNDDISETSNYFYNDQVNDTYKPSYYKIKTNIKPIHNKISNFNIESKIKTESRINKKDKNKIKSDIIQNISELDFISNRIHKSKYKINLNLLYKASIDGDKSSIFHDKCNKAQTTLILIQTKDNQRFGGFTKRTWRGNNIEKTDNDAFIFSLDKNKIYNIIKGKNAIRCFVEYNACFSGAFIINDNAFDKGGFLIKNENNYEINDITELIYDNKRENNNKENMNINFDIKEIEVYEIKIA